MPSWDLAQFASDDLSAALTSSLTSSDTAASSASCCWMAHAWPAGMRPAEACGGGADLDGGDGGTEGAATGSVT